MSSPVRRKHKSPRGSSDTSDSMELSKNAPASQYLLSESAPSVDDPAVLALTLDARLSSGRRVSESSDESEPGSHFKPMWKLLMPFQVIIGSSAP